MLLCSVMKTIELRWTQKIKSGIPGLRMSKSQDCVRQLIKKHSFVSKVQAQQAAKEAYKKGKSRRCAAFCNIIQQRMAVQYASLQGGAKMRPCAER